MILINQLIEIIEQIIDAHWRKITPYIVYLYFCERNETSHGTFNVNSEGSIGERLAHIDLCAIKQGVKFWLFFSKKSIISVFLNYELLSCPLKFLWDLLCLLFG